MDKNNIKCCFYCYGGKLQEMPYFVHRFWTFDETKAFLSIPTIEKSESEFLQKNRKRLRVWSTPPISYNHVMLWAPDFLVSSTLGSSHAQQRISPTPH